MFICIYLFLVALDLHCCIQTFSICSKWGASFSGAVQRLLCDGLPCCGAWAQGLQALVFSVCGLSSFDAGALLPSGLCDLPGPGIKSVSPELTGRFLTTGQLEKSIFLLFVPADLSANFLLYLQYDNFFESF